MSKPDALRICTTKEDLLSLPYGRRQLVVVEDDSAIAATLEAREVHTREVQAELVADQIDDERKAAKREEMRRRGGLRGVFGRIQMPDIEVDLASLPGVEGVRHALVGDDGMVDVLTIGYSVASVLQFQPGHPRPEVLYIGHPTLVGTYYPAANFHVLTFEHKFSEALRLLMCLGASSLMVERVSGWSKELAASADLPMQLTNVTAESGAKKSSDSRIMFHAELDGDTEPRLPEGLVWYPFEPTWQAIAEGRLKYGIKNFSMVVEYSDDFNVNAELSAKAANIGLRLGGKFTELEKTIWHIDGGFPD
ncbi:MAG: hypothetical protein ABI670_13900 [Chloroflexota bacterium]